MTADLPDDIFSKAARVIGAEMRSDTAAADLPKKVELRASLAQTAEVRAKLEEAGVEVVQVSRRELRRRKAAAKREARRAGHRKPLMFVDGGEAKMNRRRIRNKRKALKRRRGR